LASLHARLTDEALVAEYQQFQERVTQTFCGKHGLDKNLAGLFVAMIHGYVEESVIAHAAFRERLLPLLTEKRP
jgi:hypothetical protein